MRKKLKVILILLTGFICLNAPSVVYGEEEDIENWPWPKTWVSNGSSAESSHNGRWLQQGDWGAFTTIQANKIAQLERDQAVQHRELYYYAYARGISFPRPINKDEFNIIVEPRGYKYSGDNVKRGGPTGTIRWGYSNYSNCVNEHNYVDYYAYCAETGARVKLNDSIPDGDWNDPRGANSCDTGYQPLYYPAFGEAGACAPSYIFTAATWPFKPDQHMSGIEVVNRNRNSVNDDEHLLHCIDCLTVKVVSPSYPYFNLDTFSCKTNTSLPYVDDNKLNEYWFPYGERVTYSTQWSSDNGVPLNISRFRFSEGLDYDESKRILTFEHSYPNNSGRPYSLRYPGHFTDMFSENTENNGVAYTVDHHFYAKQEKDYSVAVEARNAEGRWNRPDKKEDHPVITPSKLRLDFTPPYPKKFSATDNKTKSCSVNLSDIVDLNALKSQNGSGFNHAKIALYPASVANTPSVKEALADSNSFIWSSSLGENGATKLQYNLEYPSIYSKYYGYWICRVRLFDNVGNHTDVTSTSTTPGTPDPKDPNASDPDAPPKYPDVTVKIFRADPTPENPTCELKSWQYKNPSNQDYWVNCSGFKASVLCTVSSNKNFSQCATLGAKDSINAQWFPSGTELFLRSSGNYNESIPQDFRTLLAKNTLMDGYIITGTGSSLKNLALDFSKSPVKLCTDSYTSYTSLMQNATTIDRLRLNTMYNLQGTEAIHAKKFALRSSGYTIFEGAKFNCKQVATEKSQSYLCFDAKYPDFDWLRVGRYKIEWSCKDDDSGISSINFYYDQQCEFPITSVKVDSNKKQVTNLNKQILDLNGRMPVNRYIYAKTTDNVGNSNIYRIDCTEIPVKSRIIVNDNYDVVKDKDLVVSAVVRPSDNKYWLKVDSRASIALSNDLLQEVLKKSKGFNPKFRLTGSGEGIDHKSPDYWHYSIKAGQPNTVLNQGINPFSNTYWVYDGSNSPSGPANFRYDRNTTSATLRWNDLDDPRLEYSFALQSHLFDIDTDWYTELETGNGRVKFASGRDHYVLKVYSGYSTSEANLVAEASSSNISSNSWDVSKLKTGEYTATVCMIDKNGNPSGLSILHFKQDEPSNFSPYRIEVGAVKDVDWEGLPYPIVFGDTNSETIYPRGTGRDLALSSYFPLGKNSFAKKLDLVNSYSSECNKIAKGYGVSFRLIKENKDEMNDIILAFSFKDDHNENLVLSQNGKKLEDIDKESDYKYNFTKLDISSNEITDLPGARRSDDSARIYKYHFLPENFEAYTSSGVKYSGPVTVHVDIYSKVNNNSNWPLQQFDFYTVTQDELASEDLEEDKQR